MKLWLPWLHISPGHLVFIFCSNWCTKTFVTVLGLDTKLYYTWKSSETTNWKRDGLTIPKSTVKVLWSLLERGLRPQQDNAPCLTRHRFSEGNWQFMITRGLFIGLLLLVLSITTTQSTSNGYSGFWQICYGLVKMTRGILRLGFCHAKWRDTIIDIKVKAVLTEKIKVTSTKK